MTDFINELQLYQSDAIKQGMSFSLDIISASDETKAIAVVRYNVSNGIVDDQRYIKTSISSDEEPDFIQSKLDCIGSFICQASESKTFYDKD